MNLVTITDQVAALAREVGAFIREERRSFSYDKVELKGPSDLVSYVDKESEKQIIAGLEKILPDAGYITEEET
ncbi:MAG: inositol monophosphatase, partial [Ekhidna sp.]|nr:inositol monophosphatase [Ekhidna sp.]